MLFLVQNILDYPNLDYPVKQAHNFGVDPALFSQKSTKSRPLPFLKSSLKFLKGVKSRLLAFFSKK